jgi:uncharacterized protein (DUF58 family)
MNFRSSPTLASKKEAASILTLALGLLLTRAEEKIGFWDESQTGRSEAALHRLGNILTASDSPDKNQELPNTRNGKSPRDFSLIQIGDFLSSPALIGETFEILSARGASGTVIQTLDPAEIELPYQGRILFEGPPEAQELVDNVESIRTAYRERIAEHINSVRQACRINRFHYILHRTDHNIADTLSTLWGMMNPLGYKPGGRL